MSEQQERNNKRIAFLTSFGIHGALLLAFLFMMAWRAPNPPLPEYGIEVNFGMDDVGGGEIQPETTPGTPEASAKEETIEETQQQQVAPQEAVEEVVSKEESPVVVKEQKKDPVKEIKTNEDIKVKETPKDVPVKEVKKETKPVEEKAETKKGDGNLSHGDDVGKTGDKGNPQGKLDAKALYGTPGGGGGGDGFGLSMSGWAWADEPRIPNLPDNEDGRIEFEIECDENGDITSIKTLQRGLSPKAEQLLKDEILKNSLMRTSGGLVPERSKGKVVFILKTK